MGLIARKSEDLSFSLHLSLSFGVVKIAFHGAGNKQLKPMKMTNWTAEKSTNKRRELRL